MKNTLKNIKKYPVIIFFGFVLYAISIGDLFSPVYERSDLENRELAKFPKFSISSLMKNKYNADIETFTTDHFIGRNTWISIKSVAESAIGKQENNGVVYGKGGYMFTKVLTPDYKQLDKNLKAVEKFMERHSDRTVTFMAVPTAPGVLTDLVYKDSPVVDSDYILKQAENTVKSGKFLNIKQVLQEHRNDYIYYRTDHHWTTYGAYYGYREYLKSVGKTPKSIDDFKFNEAEDFFGTQYSKAKSYNRKADVLSYIDCDAQITINDETDSIYDYSCLDTRDKYKMFLRGNYGFSSVKGSGKGKLLVVKDSYANCFIPYLTGDYEQIDIYDLRYITEGLDKRIEEEDYDEILFLYNCESLLTDSNLPKINLFN